MSQIKTKWWFTTGNGHVIGIIKTVDEITKEEKFRIGTGYGVDEEMDAEHIAKCGDRFFPEMIK